MSLIIDEHRQFLADSERVDRFREAIHQIVRPGDVVMDLGCGTGILGLLACEAGARRVYAVDSSGMIQVARQIAAENGMADRITFIKEHSKLVSLPERVDVVVADQIGRFGFEAGVLDYFEDARERHLKPDGQMVPSDIELCVAPVEANIVRANVDFWDANVAGFDFRSVGVIARNTGYPTLFEAPEMLGDTVSIAVVNSTHGARPIRGGGCSVITRAGELHGIAGWFSATLAPGVTLTNSPLASARILRRQVFFPIEEAHAVEAGDEVAVEMHIAPTEHLVSWRVTVRRDGVATTTFQHSTWNGMLLTEEELVRTEPSTRPSLSPRGHARKTVLDLCDGIRSLGDVERETYRRHRALFRSAAEAELFVAEVVTRYSA